MLGDSHHGQGEEMFHAFFGDQLIPANHILRALDKALDSRWVRDEVASCYSATRGRRSWDREVIVRMMLLGYLYRYSKEAAVRRDPDAPGFPSVLQAPALGSGA